MGQGQRPSNDVKSIGADIRVRHVANIPPTRADSFVAPLIACSPSSRQMLPPITFECDPKAWQSKVNGMPADLELKIVGDAQLLEYGFREGFDIGTVASPSFAREVGWHKAGFHTKSYSASVGTTTFPAGDEPWFCEDYLSAVRAAHWNIDASLSAGKGTESTYSDTSLGSKRYAAARAIPWFQRIMLRVCSFAIQRAIGVVRRLATSDRDSFAATDACLLNTISHAALGAELTTSTVGRMVGTSATATLHVGARRAITRPRAIARQLRIGRLTVERDVATRAFQRDQCVYAGARPFQSPQHKNYTSNPPRVRPGGDRAASVLLGLLAQEGGA